MTGELSELVEVAQAATAIAADLISARPAHQVYAKGDRDTVTDVDVRIEREVRAFLRDRTPEIGFLGEEEGRDTGTGSRRRVWTLDPIDGTANFVHGVPLCAVSLALVADQEPVVASIEVPAMSLRYTATRGGGAYRERTRLHVSRTTDLAASMVSIGDYAVGAKAAEKNAVRLHLTSLLAATVERVRMFGAAAIDLAWVAEGRTDAAIILANQPWDTAAGVLLAREAGAIVIDTAGNPHTFQSRETLAVTPGISDRLLSLIEQLQI